MERLLFHFEKHLQSLSSNGNEANFLLGKRPSGFDACLFGSFEAHFFFDPVPRAQFYDSNKYPNFIKTYQFNQKNGKKKKKKIFKKVKKKKSKKKIWKKKKRKNW